MPSLTFRNALSFCARRSCGAFWPDTDPERTTHRVRERSPTVATQRRRPRAELSDGQYAVDRSYPAARDYVPLIRRAMIEGARAAGAGPAVCQRVALAVSEAATNAVIHAFPKHRSGS